MSPWPPCCSSAQTLMALPGETMNGHYIGNKHGDAVLSIAHQGERPNWERDAFTDLPLVVQQVSFADF